MSTTFTVRIPRKLKQKMEENPVEWSEEVRGFLEERVRQVELMKIIREVEPRAKKRKVKVDSTILIREDRDS
jgi:predicted SAM-dependent methyltransferase